MQRGSLRHEEVNTVTHIKSRQGDWLGQERWNLAAMISTCEEDKGCSDVATAIPSIRPVLVSWTLHTAALRNRDRAEGFYRLGSCGWNPFVPIPKGLCYLNDIRFDVVVHDSAL
jgi:hypothetical protein